MKAITLQSRITILLTIFTIFAIGIFVTIQLAHELEAVNRYIEYKASGYTQEIENEFEEKLNSSLSYQEKTRLLEKGLRSLKESGFIKKAYIFDKTGAIVAATETGYAEGKGDYNDFQIIDKLQQDEVIKRDVVIDKSAKLLSVYIPLEEKGAVTFIARVFFSLGGIWVAFGQVYQPAFAIGILFVLINIILGIFLSRLIIGPIKVFNTAAKAIAAGNLDLKVRIWTNDELEELSDTFNFMAQELVKMKEKALLVYNTKIEKILV